jgi:cation-transporting ATPase E
MALTESTAVGLTSAEVDERRAAGLVNTATNPTSRSVPQIVLANVATRFNAILGALLVVILVVGPINDALFGIVLVVNTFIGIIQEVRAKRALDQLALVNAPKATVWRDGALQQIAVEDVVTDDVLQVGAGDQVIVDGEVIGTNRIEIDESLLTGESDPIVKVAGDEVLSGSFVISGEGAYRATRVGDDAYANKLAAEAKRFSLVRSELRAGIDNILRIVTYLIGPTAAVLVASQLGSHTDVAEAVRGSVAGIVAMVPEGLVLLTSVAFAVGATRLGRRRVLVNELAAIEGLARVDVVCLDKTGTITEPELLVIGLEELDSNLPVAEALAGLAAADPQPNASLRAIGRSWPYPPGWVAGQLAAFSSARRWSGAVLDDVGWVLGAPDALLPDDHPARERGEQLASLGMRVLLLASADAPLPEDAPPSGLEPAALVCLEERVREDAPATLDYFREQGVAVKVISGDHPITVAAVARRAGLDVGEPVDGGDLPEDQDELGEVLEHSSVFGRVRPHQKKAMIMAMQARGHVVAMTGDGVNDVLALKQADLGVAMGSGSAASRAVARLVLLDGSFAALPPVVLEGRRVIANIERVANLFVTKTVYAMVLAISIAVAGLEFPFLPRQLTVISTLTIGVPAFFLALAPSAARARTGFAARVLRFAIPAGLVSAAATFTGYALARTEEASSLADARTAATITLFGVAFWVLEILARPLTQSRRLLLAAMVAGFLLAISVPWLRTFYALDPPSPLVTAACIGVIAVANVLLELGWRFADYLRHRHAELFAE